MKSTDIKYKLRKYLKDYKIQYLKRYPFIEYPESDDFWKCITEAFLILFDDVIEKCENIVTTYRTKRLEVENKVVLEKYEGSENKFIIHELPGKKQVKLKLSQELENKRVIVFDDVASSYKTLRKICEFIQENGNEIVACGVVIHRASRGKEREAFEREFGIVPRYIEEINPFKSPIKISRFLAKVL